MLKSIPMRRLLLLPAVLIVIITALYLTRAKIDVSSSYTDDLLAPEILSAVDNINPKKRFLTSIDIDYLRTIKYGSEAPVIEEELEEVANYKRYLVSYESIGNKIYGLLTIPNGEAPEGGFPAIVFEHGYIPPQQYKTTERYVAYVDNLARNGFVVFKIDLRGHGESEGIPNGSYFSNGYTVDVINALKSLQKMEQVNKERIGAWGHSMAGNSLLRAMLVTDEIKAGVIWSGAVYSYEDFAKYRLHDSSYVPRETTREEEEERENESSLVMQEVRKLRENPEEIDFNSEFWKNISLTTNIGYLNHPIQLPHALNDQVVDVGYARDLAKVLEENGKKYEIYEYEEGGHNIESPYFEVATQRTIKFFKKNL